MYTVAEFLPAEGWEAVVRLWVANTDPDWFNSLSAQPGIDEINFWQPSGSLAFGAIQPGELFFFRLKSPRNAIGGYGVFSHSSNIPISLAWEAFGIKKERRRNACRNASACRSLSPQRRRT